MRRAIAMTVAAIVCVQLGSGFAKDLFGQVGPLTMVWLRVTWAGIVLMVILRPRPRGHTRRDWVLLGVYTVTLVAMNATFYQAIARIPIGLAVTIEFLGPLGVAIAKSRGARDLIWVGLAGAGVALLGWSPGSLTWAGVGFALLAAACWAGYILIVPHVGAAWPSAQPVALANLAGAAALAIPVLARYADRLDRPAVWGMGLVVGLLSSVLPYALELNALRTLDQRIFSILMSLEPAMAALSGLVILGERLAWPEVVAMACVIAASVGVTWTASRFKRGAGPPRHRQ
jgi:inner membrane transporter RhtA